MKTIAKRKSRGQRSFSQRMKVMRHLSETDGFMVDAPVEVVDFEVTEEGKEAQETSPSWNQSRRHSDDAGDDASDDQNDLPKVGMIQFAEDEESCKVLVGPELEDGSRIIMRNIDANGLPKLQDHIIVCGAVHNVRQVLYCLKNLRNEAIEGSHLWKRIIFMADDIPDGFEEGVCTTLSADELSDVQGQARLGEGALRRRDSNEVDDNADRSDEDGESNMFKKSKIRIYFRGAGMGTRGSMETDSRMLRSNSRMHKRSLGDLLANNGLTGSPSMRSRSTGGRGVRRRSSKNIFQQPALPAVASGDFFYEDEENFNPEFSGLFFCQGSTRNRSDLDRACAEQAYSIIILNERNAVREIDGDVLDTDAIFR